MTEELKPRVARPKVVLIIWFAMLFACLLYWVIAVSVKSEQLQSNLDLSMMRTILLVFAVTGVVGGGFLKKMILAKGRPENQLAGHLCAFAACEASVLYGLVLRLTGGDWGTFYLFMAIGVAGLLYYFPRESS